MNTRPLLVQPPHPLHFPGWQEALKAARLTAGLRWQFATEISRFLRYCEILNLPVTRGCAREYLAIVPLLCARPNARLALRWFFAAAQGKECSGLGRRQRRRRQRSWHLGRASARAA